MRTMLTDDTIARRTVPELFLVQIRDILVITCLSLLQSKESPLTKFTCSYQFAPNITCTFGRS